MIRLLQKLNGERGQVLPLVLAFLVVGGLTIVPSLNYVTSNLNASRSLNMAMKGTYAADAGIESTLWSLERLLEPPVQLTDNLNGMTVNIQTENKGQYTLYFGELILPGVHNDYLDVAGEIVWEEAAAAYKYTITTTWLPNEGEPVIHLDSIGARLPLNYSYQAGSAAGFAGNLSTDEPEIVLDSAGAQMVNWSFGTPAPSVKENDPVATQTFYITGSGEQNGEYTWIVANRTDVGAVGEFSGGLYRITSLARRVGDNRPTARIVADVLINTEDTFILSWRTMNF